MKKSIVTGVVFLVLATQFNAFAAPAPQEMLNQSEKLTIAKTVWGESAQFWNYEKAIASIAWVIINRHNANNCSIQSVVDTGEFYGSSNSQSKLIEKLLRTNFKGEGYNKKAWLAIRATIDKISRGELADPTGGAVFFDHLKFVPPQELKSKEAKIRAKKYLVSYSARFGVRTDPSSYIKLPGGVYLYLWA